MAPPDLTYRWRKSSRSGENGDCVELGRLAPTWRKSSRSGEAGECVELAYLGAVRDSKNPAGPVLRTDLDGILAAVKTGRFDR
jgi:hypothetical protein